MTGIWVSWLAAIAGSFALIEGIALYNSTPGDTLSEHLWAWLGVRRPRERSFITPHWTLRVARIVFLSAVLWFVLHIATGGWV